MTPQELTERYDKLVKKYSKSNGIRKSQKLAYDDLEKETGKSREYLQKRISKYKTQMGIAPREVNRSVRESTKKKTAKKIEQQAETNSDMLASQSNQIVKTNQILITKLNELAALLQGDNLNAGVLNQFASALYRAGEIRDKAQLRQDGQISALTSENHNAIYNLYFGDDKK